jgi:hypothetical protein
MSLKRFLLFFFTPLSLSGSLQIAMNSYHQSKKITATAGCNVDAGLPKLQKTKLEGDLSHRQAIGRARYL